MKPKTSAQRQRLHQLIAERITLRQQHSALARAADHKEAANKRLSDIQSERLDFRFNPERLAGLAELARRNSPDTAQWISRRYGFFLENMIDPLIPGGRPHKVDFHALPLAARPYLLGPFLGLVVGGRFPQLCLQRSQFAQGHLTYICTSGPADPAQWAPLLPKVNAWLGGSWTITATTASSITLTHRQPLPAIIPFQPHFLQKGALFLGIDTATYRVVHLPFADMTSGTFIAGVSGSGKSQAVHLLLRSIFANLDQFTAVFLCDGKDGVAFQRYANRHPKVKVLWEDHDLWALTSTLVTEMGRRNAEQRRLGIDNTSSNFIALVIDEMATYTAKPSADPKHPDNKRHIQFIDDLSRLARRGRSTGLRMIITAQEPVAEQIPTTVRNNCQTIVSFKLSIDAHATALFGQLDRLPADPRELPRGRALIKHGMTSTHQAVQFPLLSTARHA